MGRRRATNASTVPTPPTATGFAARVAPVGGARVAWSYLAALLAAAVTALGFAIADSVQSTACADDDPMCALGTYMVGGLVAGVVGVAFVAWLFRLGWEWALVCVAVVVAMPTLLDLTGPLAWLILASTPGAAALVTLSGPGRRPWRPIVVGVVGVVVIAASLIWTFFPPAA
jgi:hypothetical protein